jgi:hypothetical protein
MASPSNSFIRFGQAYFPVYPRDRFKGTDSTMLTRGRQEVTCYPTSLDLELGIHIQKPQTQPCRAGSLFFLPKPD